MRIHKNLPALNAYRNNNKNRGQLGENLEKLSSGYRINRAADDAAGLAISEKMRAQITGLEQGQQNLSDGISLVQTAEGAMEEMSAMIHRLKELTIQAYNGTYSREDRQKMQSEVDQVLKEMTRISETTNFNGIPLLQGNLTTTITVVPEKMTTVMMKETVIKDLPAWLKADDKLEVHPDYKGTQDTTGIMLTEDKNGNKIYYGPDLGNIDGYQWAGNSLPQDQQHQAQWTDTIADNYSAKIDFSGLADTTDALELYNNLFDLIGSSIGFPCGTCNDTYYGISFTGSENGYTVTTGELVGTGLSAPGNLDLSAWKGFTDGNGKAVNCFEYTMALIEQQAADPKLTDAQKEAQTKTLAEEIAKALRDETLNRMENAMDVEQHFDRAITDGTDYGIIVYDYRDQDKMTVKADVTVRKQGIAHTETPMSYLQAGTKAEVRLPIEIVCSAYEDDVIPLDFPEVTLEQLGLVDYNIAGYTRKTEYSAAYREKLEAWEQDYTFVTKTRTETYQVIDTIKPPVIVEVYENGEKVKKVVQEAQYEMRTEERTVSYVTKEYKNPKPIPGPGDIKETEYYDPSDVSVLEGALDYLSGCRGSLGAVQNRMEHAEQSNRNATENLTAAESRIRDVDMAKEMMAYTKNNILVQASQAMLAQAEQVPQGILQLLQ